MIVHTHDNVITLKLKLGETLIVEFCPDGVNESVLGGKCIGFTVGTFAIGNGRMAIRTSFPPSYTYRVKDSEINSLVLLDDPNRADELSFSIDAQAVRLVKC